MDLDFEERRLRERGLHELAINGEQVLEVINEEPSERVGFILDILIDEIKYDNQLDSLKKKAYELAELDSERLERKAKKAFWRRRIRFEEEKGPNWRLLIERTLQIVGVVAIVYFVYTGEILGL
tara:strand:- start:419 stop:790 length:372 start_codon:yes stop_codon:yes gene_type:complete